MSGDIVDINTGRGTMPVYVVRPESGGSAPGVVVIHDAIGMTSDLRNQAEWLASEGFLAAAPDLYYWDRALKCVAASFRDAIRGHGPAFDDLAAVQGWLKARPECTGSVGVVGFCMGGGFALVLASGHGYDAAAPNYGGLPRRAEEALAGACPIVGSYGARDLTLPRVGPKLERILAANDVVHDVKVYADAGHGFLNDHDLDEVPRAVQLLGRIGRTEFHEPSAVDARVRIVDFFRTHLR